MHPLFVRKGFFMKSTGIVRNVDELGRIVIPKEMRKKMGIANGDPVEIFVEGDKIILVKYNESCCLCGGGDELIEFKDKLVCKNCAEELASK